MLYTLVPLGRRIFIASCCYLLLYCPGPVASSVLLICAYPYLSLTIFIASCCYLLLYCPAHWHRLWWGYFYSQWISSSTRLCDPFFCLMIVVILRRDPLPSWTIGFPHQLASVTNCIVLGSAPPLVNLLGHVYLGLGCPKHGNLCPTRASVKIEKSCVLMQSTTTVNKEKKSKK